MIDTRQSIAASLQSATGAVWSVRDLAPVPGVFRAIPISAVADQAATLRAGRNEAIRLGFDAVAISGGLTIALPEPTEEPEVEEAQAPAVEPAPLSGEFRQDPETGVVRYWTAEEVAASPVASGPAGWNPWAAGATVQEIAPDGTSTFRAEGDCEAADADTAPEPDPAGCIRCGGPVQVVLWDRPDGTVAAAGACEEHADEIEAAIAGLAAAGLSGEEIRDELAEGIEEIRADDVAGILPAGLALALAEAKERERAILACDAAIRDADGPDEREAAQARLNALLDRFEEEDAAALAAFDL